MGGRANRTARSYHVVVGAERRWRRSAWSPGKQVASSQEHGRSRRHRRVRREPVTAGRPAVAEVRPRPSRRCSPPWWDGTPRWRSSSGTAAHSARRHGGHRRTSTRPDAIRRIVWAPGELGLSRAFVAGELSIDGDIFEVLTALRDASPRDLRRIDPRTLPATVAGRRAGSAPSGAPLPPPAEEARPAGRIHSPARDARAISHHYDVGNDFYELVLGPSWTYSCARFVTPGHLARGGPGGQVRADLPQARPRPAPRARAARRRVRMGIDGHPRRPAPRRARSSASP